MATFGYSTAGATGFSQLTAIRASKYTLAQPGDVTKISAYLTSTSSGGPFPVRAVIYASDSTLTAGGPGTLLAVSPETVIPNNSFPAAWFDFVFTEAVSLLAGDYWLGLWVGVTFPGSIGLSSDAGAASAITSTTGTNPPYSSTADPPSNFETLGASSTNVSIYATYTPWNPGPPTFKCEAAFGYAPGSATPVWTDLTGRLKRFEIRRGRQYELNRMEAGTCTATLLNLDRALEPGYSGSPYFPDVVPLVPFRISAAFTSEVDHVLFSGYVERWPLKRTGPTYAEVAVECVDGFELLNQATLPTPPGGAYPQELSGSRVSRVLDAISWSATARTIATGQSQIPSYTFSTSDGVQAASHLGDVADSEVGTFFIAGTGRAVFLDRHSQIGTAPSATLTDTPSVDAGAVGYSDIVATIDKDLITNDWIGTRDGGSTQEALDSSSITSYFRRSQTRQPLLTTDAEVLNQMQYLLAQYKNAILRIESVTVKPGISQTAWYQVITREIGDRLTIRAHPPGGGATFTQDAIVQQVDLTVDQHAASAEMVWGLLSSAITSWWRANFSVVATDTRAAY